MNQKLNHWDKFAEFCLWEMNSGGPDPQIPLVSEMSKGLPLEERLWRAGCYISVYNVPFAEVIWKQWSYDDVQVRGLKELEKWLHEHWKQIVTRVERKTVRRPEWMFEYMSSYYSYLNNGVLDAALWDTQSMSPEDRYLFLWDSSIKNVKRFGRYVALKLLESYRLYCDIDVVAPDIRPKDAWSPRTTLSVLHPQYAEQMLADSNEFNPLVNTVVQATLEQLWNDYDIQMNLFQLQVVLCEYRESYHSKKQYPGRSHDSELGYWNKVHVLWPDHKTEMFKARRNIFPWQHLGEVDDRWQGTRKECGQVLAIHDYTWTDMLYDYDKSKVDMSKPVWRVKDEAKVISHIA